MLYNVDRSFCYLRYECDFSIVCKRANACITEICSNPNYCVHKTVLKVTITELCYDCENRFKCLTS